MFSLFQKHCWCLCLLAVLFSCGQPAPPSNVSDQEQVGLAADSLNYNQGKFFPNIAFERFGTENGLPSSNVTSLGQDHQGFLWIGTENGLCRYDGRTFKIWQNDGENPHSLPSNQILDFAIDAQDKLWLLLSGKGICRFDPDLEQFQVFQDSALHLSRIEGRAKMILDAKKRLWFSEGYFDTEQKVFVPVPGIPSVSVNPIALDAAGNVFCLYADNERLWKYDEGKRCFQLYDTIPHLGEEGIYRLRVDREGNFWAGSEQGHLFEFRPNVDTLLANYGPDASVPRQYSLGNTVNDFIISEKTNLIWLAQWGGLTRFDKRPHADPRIYRYFRNEDNDLSLPDGIAKCVLEDRSGVLWVGTPSGGLAKFAPARQRFEVIRKIPGDTTTLTNNNITAVFQDSQKRLWVGTHKWLNLVDLKTGKSRAFPTRETYGCNNNWITSIAEDPVSKKLLITYWGAGFNWFDPEKGVFYKPKIKNDGPIAKESCWMFLNQAIFYAPDTILLIEWGKALNFYHPRTGVLSVCYQLTKQGKPFVADLGTTALLDEDRNLWIGMDREKGLCRTRFDGPDSIRCVQLNNDSILYTEPADNDVFLPDEQDPTRLASGTITALFEDSQHRLWVGTPNGLHLMVDRKKGIFRRFGKKEKFSDTNISGILEDAQGMLWVSTSGGLFHFNPSTGLVEDVYRFTDGLPSNQFNGMSCFKNSEGLMFWGSIKGLVVFHPEDLGINKIPPPVSITRINADGKEIRFAHDATEVDIPPSTENLQVEYAALDFTRPENNQFQYQLEHFEQKMSARTSEGKATFTNIPPGKYRFHVIAGNNDNQGWNMQGAYLTLRVRPEWYQTIWFRASLLLLFLGIAYYFTKRYVKGLQKRQEEIRREIQIKALQVQVHQAQMNPHFIFNVLTAIKHLIVDKRQEEAAAYMDEFAILIRRYLDASVKGDISHLSAVQNELPLSQEIELIDMYVKFEQLKYKERFDYVLEVAPGLVPENISLPPMLIQPFVENAIKHGLLHMEPDQKGLLRVSFYMDEDGETLHCIVEDNGVGIDEARRLQEHSIKHYESHGVRLTNDRVKILNQIGYQITINGPEDRAGGGTIVEISIA